MFRLARVAGRALVRAEESGNCYALAGTVTGLAAANEYMSYKRNQRNRLEMWLELEERSIMHTQRMALEASEPPPSEPDWRGTVVKSKPLMLLGDVMLRGARVGQEVEVLAEDQGLEGGFLQCRNVQSGAVGLYPTSWVRRIPEGLRQTLKESCISVL